MKIQFGDNEYEVVLTADYRNVQFVFGYPLTHNGIHENERGYIRIYNKEEDSTRELWLDRSELEDWYRGLFLLLSVNHKIELAEQDYEVMEGEDNG